MKTKKSSIRQISTITILCIMVLAPMIVNADSPNPNSKIVPVDSKPYGSSYGDWSAKWWQWAYSMPIDHHPLFDTADCSAGQTGNAWFLGAGFASTEPNPGQFQTIVNRDCKIPAGKAIFFPVANAEASTLEGNGNTFDELSANATQFQNGFTVMSAEVDGISIKNLNKYRVQSPLFVFGPLPDNNVLQFLGFVAPQGATSNSVADGVYLMTVPLAAGNHKIHFHAEAPSFNFLLDVTYNLEVS